MPYRSISLAYHEYTIPHHPLNKEYQHSVFLPTCSPRKKCPWQWPRRHIHSLRAAMCSRDARAETRPVPTTDTYHIPRRRTHTHTGPTSTNIIRLRSAASPNFRTTPLMSLSIGYRGTCQAKRKFIYDRSSEQLYHDTTLPYYIIS